MKSKNKGKKEDKVLIKDLLIIKKEKEVIQKKKKKMKLNSKVFYPLRPMKEKVYLILVNYQLMKINLIITHILIGKKLLKII